MEQYIQKSALIAEIERRVTEGEKVAKEIPSSAIMGLIQAYNNTLSFIDTLEVKEVDLEKLGEIARHLIAVKEHIEDMRLDKEEWFMLEKIGYPERFKAQKGEEV